MMAILLLSHKGNCEMELGVGDEKVTELWTDEERLLNNNKFSNVMTLL